MTAPTLARTTFRTSRLLGFGSPKQLIARPTTVRISGRSSH